MVGEQLQGNDFQNRQQVFVGGRQGNEIVRTFNQVGFVLVPDRNDNPVARFHFPNIVENLFITLVRVLGVRVMSGKKDDGEIFVNQTTAGNQRTPVVAALSDGRFVVAYEDNSGGTKDIKARVFDLDGSAAAVNGEIPPAQIRASHNPNRYGRIPCGTSTSA